MSEKNGWHLLDRYLGGFLAVIVIVTLAITTATCSVKMNRGDVQAMGQASERRVLDWRGAHGCRCVLSCERGREVAVALRRTCQDCGAVATPIETRCAYCGSASFDDEDDDMPDPDAAIR